MRYEEEYTIEQLRADVSQLQARAIEAERQCAELAAALNQIGIGGNHLASALINKLGAGTDTFPPYNATYEQAQSVIPDPNDRDLWVCWQTLMRVRDDLEQKTSAILAQHDAEVECRVLERVMRVLECVYGPGSDMPPVLDRALKREFAPKGEAV